MNNSNNKLSRVNKIVLFVVIFTVIIAFGSFATSLTKLPKQSSEKGKQFVHQFMEQNKIDYESMESFSTVDYVFLVRDDEAGVKKGKITDNFTGRTCLFKIQQDNTLQEVLCYKE